MKKIFLLLVFLGISEKVYSQVRFDSLYNFYGQAEVGNSIIVEQSNYIIGGIVEDPFAGSQKLALLSLDLSGNVIYKKSYGSSNADYYLGAVGSLVKTYDGGYMMGGGVSLTTGISMLMKVDGNGDSLWTKFYGDTISWETIYQIKQTHDSGFICVGGYNPTGPALVDVLVIKTDSVGNVQWRKTFGLFTNTELAFSVQQTYDGGYVVGASKAPSSGLNYNTWLLRLDSIGGLKWQRTYGNGGDDYSPCIQNSEIDTSYVLATNLSKAVGFTTDSSIARFIKVNDSGTTIWDKTYGSINDFYLPTSFEKTFDGNYIAAGQGSPTNQFGPNVSVLGRIFKINPQGDSLWYRSYYPSTQNCNGLCNQNYLRDIKPTPDGGYIACGFVADSFQDMWVIKVDSMGCVDTLCVVPTAVGSLEVGSRDIKIYPNPALSNITISAPLFVDAVLTVNDIEGRVLLQRDFNKEIEINVGNLKQGMYVIALQNDKTTKAVKFVKQ